MTVRFTCTFSDYERYQIAFYNDSTDGKLTREDWNNRPRLATRKECVDYIQGELINGQLCLGDMSPNLNPDGTIGDV